MEIGGVDLSAVTLDNSEFVVPDVVPGRCLNGDGDIYAYNCAGNDDTSREEVIHNLETEVKNKMILAGADCYHLHITADGSDKGKRHDYACVNEYQYKRKGKPKPKNLAFARLHIKNSMNSTAHLDQEADDGLAQYQHAYIDRGERNLCVLDSADKDLRMVNGLHLDPYTGAIVDVDGYGSCWYDEDKAKVFGWGQSFFWHQLLMGDGADDIPGLKTFGQDISLERWPTAPLIEQQRRLTELTMPSGKDLTEKQYTAAGAKLAKLRAEFKCKPCGAKGVFEYLHGITNNFDAKAAVVAAYEGHYGTDPFEFTDWRGNTYTRTAYKMMIEQGLLLWMRRKKGAVDLTNFLLEVDNGQV